MNIGEVAQESVALTWEEKLLRTEAHCKTKQHLFYFISLYTMRPVVYVDGREGEGPSVYLGRVLCEPFCDRLGPL